MVSRRSFVTALASFPFIGKLFRTKPEPSPTTVKVVTGFELRADGSAVATFRDLTIDAHGKLVLASAAVTEKI